MFTGLIQSLGEVAGREGSSDGARLEIATELASELREGDSIAVNGVCLTAAQVSRATFCAEVMNETLARSALSGLDRGARVNLELPLRAADRLGGHFVQGHVDGVGTVSEVTADGFSRRVRIESDPELLRYVVVKGAITVDGVSLTVTGVTERSFTVSVIPETLQRTTLGGAQPGAQVNLEVDVLAKYVEKLVGAAA